MKLCLRILILALLGGAMAASAQVTKTATFTVTFQTDPPGARVMGNTSFLGLSGEPITMTVPEDRQRVVVSLELEGYHPQKLSIPLWELQSASVYPAEGAVTLTPLNNWVRIRRFVRENTLLLGVGLVALVGLGMRLRRRQSTLEEKANRAERLEELEARATTEDDLLMQTLGQYRLTELLGMGGMAAVYRAVPEDTLDEGEAVAVKVLHREVTRNPEFRQRFEREIKLYRSLSHPSIVRLVDWGDQQNLTYLVMELVQGQTLDEVIPERGLTPSKAMGYLQPLVEAVQYAHDRGVVHRDLKPENVMVREDGRVKLMDFGLARDTGSATITKTGHFMGTPAFVAPEQVTGKHAVGPRADQYALGILAYQMLCGRTPFDTEDPQQLVFQQAFEPAPPITTFKASLPDGASAVLARMLEKDPEARFPSVREAFSELSASLGLKTGG